MIRSLAVSLALVGLFVWLTACSSYSQIGLAEVADHGKVRVTTTDGERETIRDPAVEADSIKGLGKKVGVGVSHRVSLAIPLDRVTELEAVGTEIGTVFTVIGFAVLTAAAAVGIFLLVCEDGMLCPR